MCCITCFLALLAIGVTIFIGIYTYYHGNEPHTSFRAGYITFLGFTIVYLAIPLFSWDQIRPSIPQSTIDQITVLSLIFALISIAFTHLKETKANNPSTPLNSKIVTTQTNITPQVDNNTQEIIERSDQSQEIARRLDRIAVALEQITTRLDRNQEIIKRLDRIERYVITNLPAAESSEEPKEDEDPENG